MRKNYFFMALAGMLLASCSNEMEEVFDTSQGNEISFRPFVEAMTRAADVTTANLTSFNVTAYRANTSTTPFMDNVAFTKDGSTFTSAEKYFWPDNNLDFYAYAPTDGAPATLATTGVSGNQIIRTAYNEFTITPSSTLTSQTDFVFAKVNNIGKGSSTAGAIALNFRHTESKIVVKFKNSQPHLKFEVSAFKVVNVDGSATFIEHEYNTNGQNTDENESGTTFAATDWTNNTAAGEQTVTYSTGDFTANLIPASQATAMFLNHAENTPNTSVLDENLSMILVPQVTTLAKSYSAAAVNAPITTGSYIAVKMVIKNNSDGTVIADATGTVDYSTNTYDKWAMWPVKYNWKPGKKYVYTVDLGDGGYWEVNNDTDTDLDPILENTEIKFVDVTVDEWDAEAKSVVKAPETLAQMKAYINAGIDCVDYIGLYVDASGNLSSNSAGAIGAIAYISKPTNSDPTLRDVDEGVTGSRILVVAMNNANSGNTTVWDNNETLVESGIVHTESTIKDSGAYNGYLNTQALYIHSNRANYLAAKYAWEYDGSKIGSAVLTGSSPWFLPSFTQLYRVMDNKDSLQDVIVFRTGSDTWSHVYYGYWTSTECTGNPANNAYGLWSYGGQEANKKASSNTVDSHSYYVRPVFVY